MKREFNFEKYLAEQMLEVQATCHWGASFKWFSNTVHDGYCTKDQIIEWRDMIHNNHMFCADSRDSYLLRPYRQQVVLLYTWSSLLLASGDEREATYRTRELWDLIVKDEAVELSRRDKAVMAERLRVYDVKGALSEIMEYLRYPDLVTRVLTQSNVTPSAEEFTHISEQDNIICYFKDGAPVVVKYFDYSGRLYMGEDWFGREPTYFSIIEDGYKVGDDTVSPIYQVIKAQRMFSQALRFVGFECKPVRKIIVAPDYKAIFDNPERFAEDCEELGIELHQDLTALTSDSNVPYCDLFYWFKWSKAIQITDNLYRVYRTINSRLIGEIIEDLHGEGIINEGYDEESVFSTEEMEN